MSRLLTYGIMQQRRKVTLGFETYCAPESFDRASQPVDIYTVFINYLLSNSSAKYIYSVADATTSTAVINGSSYRYGYTDGGTDHVVDLNNITTTTSGYSGVTNIIDVVDNSAFPATGTIMVGTAPFIYTSKPSSTRFSGANQNVGTQPSGSTVSQSSYTITWVVGSTKKWVIVNTLDTSPITLTMGYVSAVWLYCGNLISGLNTRYCTSLTYIHIDKLSNITSYNFISAHSGSNLTGVLNISSSAPTPLGNNFCDGCTKITSINLGTSITSISLQAFRNCTGVTGTVTIPDSCTSIGQEAFRNCTLTGLTINSTSTLTSIGQSSFYDCNKITSELALPNSLTTLSASAFYNCSKIPSVAFGNSLTTIGQSAFQGCTSLQTPTFPDNIITIGISSFNGCTGMTNTLSFNKVVTIGATAFGYCTGLSGTLTITADITSIGEGAFVNDNFNAIDVSANAGYHVHDDVLYQESTHTALHGVKSKSGTLTIESDTEIIGNYCFYYNSSRTGAIVIPDHVTRVGTAAFSTCTGFTGTLTFNTATPVLTLIGGQAFLNCNLTGSLTLPTSLTTIQGMAFYGCDNFSGTLVIPDSVTSMPQSGSSYTEPRTFYGCSGFTGLTLGTGMTAYLQDIFRNCTSMTGTLAIPSGVTAIGNYCFASTAFTRVNSYPNTQPTTGTGTFDADAMALHVPTGTSSYTTAPWTTTTIFATLTKDL